MIKKIYLTLVVVYSLFSCTNTSYRKRIKNNISSLLPNFNFIDYEDHEDKKGYTIKEFSEKAPSYRIIYEGLNLERECQNCSEIVWTNIIGNRFQGKKGPWDNELKRFKIIDGFSIGEITAFCDCSNCNARIDEDNIIRLGFYKCNYFISGRRAKETKFAEVGGEAKENGLRYFNVGKVQQWKTISIAVWKLS